jgi:hypothetical protein
MAGRSRLQLLGVAGLWILAIGGGFSALLRFELTPGAPGTAVKQCASDDRPLLPGNRPTLMMLAHPLCPCTRASLDELEFIMTECRGGVNAYVLFYEPSNSTSTWSRSQVWRRAAAIPGVRVLADRNGARASRLGGQTSGTLLVWDPSGRALFKGGITGARGHVGLNEGRQTVIRIVRQQSVERTTTPVFGCPLFGSSVTEKSGTSQ